MNDEKGLRIDLGQFYSRQPVSVDRESWNTIERDIIGNSFDGGAAAYKRETSKLREQTEGKVFVDEKEFNRMKSELELSRKYRDRFPSYQQAQTPQPTQNQYERRGYQPPQQNPVQEEPKPNEQEPKSEDYFSSLFSAESQPSNEGDTSGASQAQNQQEPERDTPTQHQQAQNDNPQMTDPNIQAIRHEFYRKAIEKGVDPEQALNVLNSMSVEDSIEWAKHRLSSSNGQETPKGPKSLSSLNIFGRQQVQQPQQAPQQQEPPRPAPTLHELPEPTHPMTYKKPTTSNNNHIFR